MNPHEIYFIRYAEQDFGSAKEAGLVFLGLIFEVPEKTIGRIPMLTRT